MRSFSLPDVLEAVGITTAEQTLVQEGQLVKGVVESTTERELAVKFAFVVPNLTPESGQAAFMESTFKKHLDPSVKEIGHFIEGNNHNGDDPDAGAAKAFETLCLEPNSEAILTLYRNAGPGDDLNLSDTEISTFQKLGQQASKVQVEQALREQLLERYMSYRKLGLKGVAPYQRSKSKSYNPGEELQHKTELMQFIKKNIPEFHKYILEYPHGKKLDGLVETFSWTSSLIDDLPTIALVHKLGYPLDGGVFVFFQRFFYVSRSHNSVQGIGGCFPIQGRDDDSVLVLVTRTSTDKVAGFGGAAKRAMGARIMGGKQAENFERLRSHTSSNKK